MKTLLLPLALLLKMLPSRIARLILASAAHNAEAPSIQKRQLLVDISVIYRTDARTGIQRVVRSLLLQLVENPPSGYDVRPIYATVKHKYCYANSNIFDPSWKVESSNLNYVSAQAGDLFLALDLAAHLIPRHHVQILNWKLSGVKIHVVVYDLLPLQYPEWFNEKTTQNFKRWIRWVATYADGAICISNSVKNELSTWLNLQHGSLLSNLHTSTIVLGADIAASAPSSGLPSTAHSLIERMSKIPSVLMVGTIEPRKGYEHALRAFEQLWSQQAEGPLLVIVGRPGWKTDTLQHKLRTHPQSGKNLFWLEDASDEFLSCLYVACKGILAASLAEGFGLPLIEALTHNKQVLARDLPVFRELASPGITFFSCTSECSLSIIISNWLENMHYGETMCNISQNCQEKHNWPCAAQQLLLSLGLPAKPHQDMNICDAGSPIAT